MIINQVGGENVNAEVQAQTPLVEAIAELTIFTGKPEAKYLWTKFTSENGDFVGLVISNNLEEYKEGIGEDGFYYQRVEYIVGTDDNGTYLLEL